MVLKYFRKPENKHKVFQHPFCCILRGKLILTRRLIVPTCIKDKIDGVQKRFGHIFYNIPKPYCVIIYSFREFLNKDYSYYIFSICFFTLIYSNKIIHLEINDKNR